MIGDNNKIKEAQLVSKTEQSSKMHLTSADAVASVLSFGDVSAIEYIDRMCSRKRKRQKYNRK